MKQRDPKLLLQHAPFLRQNMTTEAVMRDVLLALLPAVVASVWFFGMSAILVLVASIAGAVVTEWSFSPTEERRDILFNGSGLVTGLLLGMTLPPGLPMWMAFVGGVVAIGLGKLIWGGLGSNLFNPALVGRAFLLATFPTAMTTWNKVSHSVWSVSASNLSLPFTWHHVDGMTAATPLNMMKFEHHATPLTNLIIGNTGGSLGETSGLLLLLGGIYLVLRRDIDWRIPVGILVTAMVFSGVLDIFGPVKFPTPLFSVFAGGMLLGSIFMATDPVTSPSTTMGVWIFSVGIGLLVILIRVFGGLPEGVMYSILLMNAASPLIERFTQPRVFGYGRSSKS